VLGVLSRVGVLIAASLARAQVNEPAHVPPPYQKLRYDEDYSYLADPAQRSDFWDTIKFIPLADDAAHLTLGGEARERYEYYRNARWSAASPDQDGYFLQRYLLHADLRAGQAFRVFAQLQTSLENWRNGGPRPTDEDRTDLHQLFADIRLWSPDANHTATLRVGRQEMLYGSQRLVSVRESPNIRRSFDAARLLTHLGEWQVDALFAKPVEDDRGSFDDGSVDGASFWGIYGTHPLSFLPGAKVDLYYLGLRRPDAPFVQGTADELRHSFGARIFGEHTGWDYNFESVAQVGHFGNDDILAWTLASDTGFTFRCAPFSPRAGLRADIISGDGNPGDGRLGTFNPLFPRGAYFGEIALIGPNNLIDIHPSLEFHVTDRLKVSADWDFFWRYSTADGLYDNGGNVLRRPGGSGARFVGHQPSLGVDWEIDRHTAFSVSYAHFFAGSFIQQSGPSRDVDFIATWLTYRF